MWPKVLSNQYPCQTIFSLLLTSLLYMGENLGKEQTKVQSSSDVARKTPKSIPIPNNPFFNNDIPALNGWGFREGTN
jgi:hypothetical protein